MNKRLISLSLILIFTLQIIACRFTVREIGFSTLSRDLYSLVYIDEEAIPGNTTFNDISKLLINSNIGLLVLNPEVDISHPAVISAKEARIQFPAAFLMSPDGRIFQFENLDLNEIVREILSSSLTEQFINNFYNSFAYTVLIESKNSIQNSKAEDILRKACMDITDRIPNMPKQVRKGPSVLKISVEDFKNEKTLLWALGINEIPDNPKAFVIYGRGRIIGDILSYDEILDNRPFQFLAMIGADCECGLDRKWMLGDQIPLNWPKNTRQHLTDELGFDVDNPMIMAEMSHILSKDPLANPGAEITFAPEEIDLDKLFPANIIENAEENRNKQKAMNPLFIIIIFSALVLITGTIVFVYKRNRN